MIEYLRLIRKLWKFMRSSEYREARQAVRAVSFSKELRELGEREGQVSYCPRCGQRPSFDVRHDEAFELAFDRLLPKDRKRHLHFAIELACWLR